MLACGTAPHPQKTCHTPRNSRCFAKSLVPQGFFSAATPKTHRGDTERAEPAKTLAAQGKQLSRAFARESGSTARRHQQGIDRHAEGIGDALQVVQGDVSDLALAVRNKGAM
jgi:hypothetical protein